MSKLKILLTKSDWSAEDTKWFYNYIKNSNQTELKETMQQYFISDLDQNKTIDPLVSKAVLEKIYQKIEDTNKVAPKRLKIRFLFSTLAAACILGVISFGLYFQIKRQESLKSVSNKYANDINPGGNNAILTLSDGSSVELDSVKGNFVKYDRFSKISNQNGILRFSSLKSSTDEASYNTITTPKGGQYLVVLADGTKVWLNSASSLKFPSTFQQTKRTVEVTGEAYFEVAKKVLVNKKGNVPFTVKINSPSKESSEIEVLGTHFNVNAYNDEASVKTTLVEGSIKFKTSKKTILLKPGQQSKLLKSGSLVIEKGINLDKTTAWKDGFFDFNGVDFEVISKQLSRWYKVDIKYDKKSNELFYAKIPKNTMLSDVLKALELTGELKFEISNNNVVIAEPKIIDVR